ncbi:hypothetical protein Ccrd_004899 [Cynara cardunculus var. scolymus]|uniref:At5g58720/SDE5-like UBA-like domain-containing protein n=1 Tax=Cynara cardunculus var. scolymus TaxID=59895 RepID=A0A124SC90_CYNCS|nr:hypothetical protein Ccrd_004899 [Cynara cardunculus var. scolymus]
MTRMDGPSSSSTCSNDDDKNLEWLFEAFGSKISINDMASAYCQAEHDLRKASEIICNMLGSSSSNDIPISTDDLTSESAVGSDNNPMGKSYETRILSQPKPTNSGISVGTVSGADTTMSATSINEPPKVLSRSKPKNSGISVGTISGIIGAGYGRSRPSTKEYREITKPVKLMSTEFPVSQIWVEKPQSVNATTGTMNKEIEQFLLKMLGDGFKLDMGVIKEVVGGCGYDVRESMEKLMDMSSPTLDQQDVTPSMVNQTKSIDARQDLDIKCEEKLKFTASGSGREDLEKEVLCNLFTVPERSEVKPRKILPKREPRTRQFGLVTGPLEEGVTEFRTPIVKKEGNEQNEDNYEILREAAMEFWITMKKYYRAAADAYAKGSYELADKLIKERRWGINFY